MENIILHRCQILYSCVCQCEIGRRPNYSYALKFWARQLHLYKNALAYFLCHPSEIVFYIKKRCSERQRKYDTLPVNIYLWMGGGE